ncbi:hypothetical protein ABL78_6717 [Leptomonas seymouri]|uniref:Uncharacterized protein n=1 Tax=Leptomonas seymouri TaxID=5684 RepID=A0A0N1I1M0_LEPSE|nr:hypothetical protein ABL78_6717 [Leptomonas seymouri]|eukprot:KPI84231.1 hypothetical protein ABL78_6717 [Leptomonas seymouri]
MSLGVASPGPAPPGEPSMRQVLAERILQHKEEKRQCAGERRRIGTTAPTEEEVASILAARKAAAARAHEEELENDIERTGVTALRCYDVSLDKATSQPFQAPVHLSDVQARQDLVRPLNKLMAILALRMRLASTLKRVMASRSGRYAKLDVAESDASRDEEWGPFTLSASPLPQLSTLLRELPLPDIASQTLCNFDAAEHASAQLLDVPHSRPFHDPFLFRLRHFTPVGMPTFSLDISTQADKETHTGTAEPLSSEAGEVPAMDAPQPLASLPAANLVGCDDDGVENAGGLAWSLARASSEASNVRHVRGNPADKTGGADAETFPSVLRSHARPVYTTGLMQPQGM